VAGALCALAVGLKFRFGYDDSLDVVGVHLVGGIVGTVLIGVFATANAPAAVDGLLYGGGLDQLGRQVVAAGAVMVYSFVLAFVIGKAIDVTIGFRASEEAEITGVDLTTHAESAYELGSVTGGGYRGTTSSTSIDTTSREKVQA
jgi:Amt family ammonium transporter